MGNFLVFWAILLCRLSSIVVADLPHYVGSHDRFWSHNKIQKTIIIDGIEKYHDIESCINHGLTEEDRQLMSVIPHNRTIGQRIVDSADVDGGDEPLVIFLEVLNAMTPIHVKAVQTLAACIREHVPTMHEKRPMYLEFGLDEDVGLGGNNPTHLAPLLSMFLPEVKEDMMRTMQLAYNAANWKEQLTDIDESTFSKLDSSRARIHPEPKDLGFRASEHLTYSGFPSLGDHHDGEATAYTLNFAFAAPEDYGGGFLYLYDGLRKKTSVKPSKYSACVFLGGLYMHGVTEITKGHREMFSSELWFNPDSPIGASLWTSTPESMDEYIRSCNSIGQVAGEPCKAAFPDVTQHGISANDNREGKFIEDNGDDYDKEYWDEEERYPPSNVDFLPVDEEPHFLVPVNTSVAEIFPLYFRESGERVKDDEAFGIALPPELLVEFQRYIKTNGMLRHARQMTYEGEGFGNGEHRLLKLDDNMTWGCMGPRWEGMDMVWIDPADEESFERTLSILRRGNFDLVLDAVGKHFDLDSLMVTGIGPIFLSHFNHDPEYNQIHSDLFGAKGSFYNVVVPLHIPEGGASLYVGDDETAAPLQMHYNVGTLLGSETKHGTGECDYRAKRDVRLSMAVYMADLNDDNADLIASDSTSLWPTEGDLDWFESQKGRVWRRDGSRSLRNDKGRTHLNVQDQRGDCASVKHLCMDDPTGVRLECVKTCAVYLTNDSYYSKLQAWKMNNTKESKMLAEETDHEDSQKSEL